MARVLTVTANPLLNFHGADPIHLGAVNRTAELTPVAEGKGVNVARVLAAHGHQAQATGFAGGPTGAMLDELVATSGVATAFIATNAPLRIGFQVPGSDPGHPTTLLADGFAVRPTEAAELCQRIDGLVADQDLVIVSGSVPDPTLSTLYRDILAICAAHEVPCWIDAYGPAMDTALGGPHPPQVTKPNRQEWASSADWQRATEVHRTDGKAMVTVFIDDQRFTVRPPPVDQVNPIGSGDCYLAGYAHARLSGAPTADALAYAAAAGAANAARATVATIGPDDVEPLVAAAQVEEAAP